MMRQNMLSAVLVAFFATTLVVCAAEDPAYIQLDANNFQLEIDSRDIVIVCFYHSKGDAEEGLDEEFVLAAEKMRGKGATFAAVDCAYEKTLQKKYEVEDFPTVRLFRDAKNFYFRRALESNAIVSFVESLLQPPVRTISSVAEAIDLTESHKAVLIGFFSPENTKEYEAFLAVASTFQSSDDPNTIFAEVVNPKVVKDFEIVYTPMVFLFRPNDDTVGYTGMFNEKELADWITVSTTPTLHELLPETFLTVFEDNTPTLLAFVDKSLPDTNSLLTNLTEVSVKFLHKVNFAFTERTHFAGLAEKMGVPESGNVITILDFHKREHYIMNDEMSPSKISQFCDDFLKGQLTRSEDGDVSAKSKFDENHIPETVVIANPTNDLMMDFYVPWCDFYINIGVPHSGLPRVSLLTSLPDLSHLSNVAQVDKAAPEK